MANNRIVVKRTSTAGRTPNTTNAGNLQYIAAGELALNMTDKTVFTSDGTNLIYVGSNTVDQNVSNTLTVKFISANGGVGTSGQVLTSGAAGNVYWSTVAGGGGSGTVTSVATGNGLTGGPITSTGTVSVVANSGIVANTFGLFVNTTYIATLTANNSTYFGGYTWAAPPVLGSTTANGASLTYANVSGQVNASSLLLSNSGPAINLTSTTSGWISFPTGTGYAPPSTTTSSVGTKLLLYPGVSPTNVEFAVGIEAFGMWHSVPINTATYQFKWYANTTQLMSLNGVGALSVNGSINAASLSLSTNTATIGTGSYFVSNGNVGVGTNAPSYKLQVNGSFAATTKSFIIDHPTKPDMKLRYGSLEGPENGVYVRGRIMGSVIELPDHWEGLVNSDTITVSLTPIGKTVMPSVMSYDNKTVVIHSDSDIDCFYHIFGERKDVNKLVVEF